MNIYYFVGNLPVQGIHAQTIFEKLGGTFVVWSKEAKEFCTQKKWPVIMWNTYQEQNHLFIEPDKVSETIFYLNQNQNIIFFFDLYNNFIKYLDKATTIFMSHGYTIKSWYWSKNNLSWRSRVINEFDYCLGQGPYVKNNFLSATDLEIDKIWNVGVPRFDKIISQRNNKNKYQKKLLELGFDKNKKIIAYVPTYYGYTSLTDFGIDLLKNWSNKYNLIFRPHPETPKEILDKCLDIIKNKKYIKYLAEDNRSKISLEDIVLGADAFIVDFSSVTFDCYLTRKPFIMAQQVSEDEVIQEQLGEILKYLPIISKTNVKDVDKLIESVFATKVPNSVYELTDRKLFYSTNGDSVKTISEKILEIDKLRKDKDYVLNKELNYLKREIKTIEKDFANLTVLNSIIKNYETNQQQTLIYLERLNAIFSKKHWQDKIKNNFKKSR